MTDDTPGPVIIMTGVPHVAPETSLPASAETGFPADPDGVPLADLEAAICGWAGRIASSTCNWLLLLAAFDRRGGWSGIGLRSCAHRLSWRCGLNERTARDHIATAHALTRLPAIRAAFAAGTVSYSKVRAIARVARADTEETWLNHAHHCTAGALERLARAYRQRTADPDDRARTRSARRVTWRIDDDGMVHVAAVLAPEEGAQLITAMEAARQSPVGSAAEPTAERDAEALAALAEAFLHHAAPGLVEPTHTLTVHVKASDLLTQPTGREDPTEATGWVDNRPQITLPRAVLQRLGCDGMIRTLLTDQKGNPLRLGRRRRLPTRRLRAAVQARDHGTCQYPGCTHTRWLHIHHLTPWAEGGRTDLHGLTLVCSAHHRYIHDEGVTLRRNSHGTITADLPDRRTLVPAPSIDSGRHPATALARGTEHISPGAIVTREGGPLNLDESLYVLLQPRTCGAGC
ncbi:HNH endonuclease signature motif containing protein [Parafrankia sp. FMc2]|uniref:HNH endonuclease signature motif containing protein n=1 Tax=Parafrankia sp. FMc2 TaxID=3233196 RepID=UPI0034D5ECCF